MQSSDANAAPEANQTLQEELAKLRQEVPPIPAYAELYSDQNVLVYVML